MERLDMDHFDAVYARMLFVSGKRTQSELAELLNLQQGSISEAKKRGIIPLSWCVRVSDLFHVRMDWLRFGEPPVFMSSARQEYPARDEGVSGFRQPPPPPLERTRPGELPVYGTVRSADGAFPVVDRQIFPLEFTRRGVEIFRVLESCMAPALNAGALVAVAREAEAENGALVAVLGGSGLQFRRLFITPKGYELRAECGEEGKKTRLVSKEDWPNLYYGRAVWAFQPL